MMAQNAFLQKLAELNIVKEQQEDLTGQTAIQLDEPRCAYVNITNVDKMPWSKTDEASIDMHAIMEVYDGNGHFFEKKILLNAQGNSSMSFVKKNFAVDFCEDEWKGSKTTSITIGDWVTQDAFHFKAFYTDYFRGIGECGFKLFDDIIADHNTYQDRAGLEEYDPKARCYPGGFPCIVYLNGDFYGIYAWQLKKHRDNMSQVKDNPAHIHLDGIIDNATFWRGTIQWNQFEIRNPKDLYCVDTEEVSGYIYVEITDAAELEAMGDNYEIAETNPKDMLSSDLSANSPAYYQYTTSKGKIKYYKLVEQSGTEYVKYNGDYPNEIIDASMPEYNPENKKHVMTNQVKQYLIAASNYHNDLTVLKKSLSKEDMKAAIEERFDVTGIIDYMVFSLVTSNYDGFKKNWQWFTYDGIKWFVAPYDLDGIFGAIFTGKLVMPVNWSYTGTDYKMNNLTNRGPVYWVKSYFLDEIEARYEYLRNQGIFTPEHIMSYVYDWYNRVGADNYNLEWQKWPNSYCIHPTVCNPNWTTTDDWTGYSAIADYDKNQVYYEGDKCKLDQRIWIATGETKGVRPYQTIGYEDNASRVQMWLNDRIALEDDYLSHITAPQSSYDLVITSAQKTTLCVPFAFDIPAGVHVYSITGVDSDMRLVMEEVLETEANKAYFVFGPQGVYNLSGENETYDERDGDGLSNGLLSGTYSAIYVPVGGYVLQNKNGQVGFYHVSRENYISLAANRAYLEIPPLNVRRRDAMMVEEPTAIDNIMIDDAVMISVEAIYDTNGEQRTSLSKGLNIVKYSNGETKKIMIK